jgi:hypothetical protein
MRENPIITLFMLASVALPVAAWLVIPLVLVANSTAAISVLTSRASFGGVLTTSMVLTGMGCVMPSQRPRAYVG